jgi:hypothetical protein
MEFAGRNAVTPSQNQKRAFRFARWCLSGPTAIRVLEKSFFDLGVHSMQPLLRPLAFLAISLRLSLEFVYPFLCRTKLLREFLRHVEGFATVGLSSPRCFMQ